jgi:pimeloyl-ACP methyl ester carboxylesterase
MSRLVPRLAGLAVPAFAALGLATSASAAPIVGPAGDAFYTPPSSVPAAGTPGELISYRQAAQNLGSGLPSTTGYDILYRSTDSSGKPNFVTGSVLIPSGSKATVGFAFGTQGLAPQCAPSKQLAAGTEYEGPNVALALKSGYSVVGSDYAGYTTGTHPAYTAGASEGHAVLDALKAAQQIPTGGTPAGGKTALWGFSQGGQAASWAAELAPTYAPDLNLIGLAVGGVPANLQKTAENLNKSVGASFLLEAVVGLANEYPEDIPFDELSNATGKAARDDAQSNLCVFAALNKYINRDIADFTTGGQTLAQLTAIPSVKKVIDAQQLGTKAVPVPVYHFHGQGDEIVPLQQDYDLKKAWCAKGVKDQFELYPSEHIVSALQAGPSVVKWIQDRLDGKAAPSTCNNGLPDPVSNADPAGGDFNVPLSNWNLTGTATLAKLNQSLVLPGGSTFSGNTNLTAKRLTGTLKVNPFLTPVTLFGIKINTAIRLVPAGDTSGSASLDDNGQLHITANAPVVIYINSLSVGPIKLGTNCRTQSTVHIPLKYDGSVANLGAGGLTFNSTATFPPLTDCGLYGPLLSALISGSGNKFALNVAPPAPKPY